jgi:hypothetical protein
MTFFRQFRYADERGQGSRAASRPETPLQRLAVTSSSRINASVPVTRTGSPNTFNNRPKSSSGPTPAPSYNGGYGGGPSGTSGGGRSTGGGAGAGGNWRK